MTDGILLGPELLERLAAAHSVLVLTGAGMSAESGIPTFREAQRGLWARYRPEELATPEGFAAHPERVWRWYESRREAVRAAQPHAGHRALVELEAAIDDFVIATQNVDGLHQRAGSTQVIELHGNILRSKCHRTHRPIGAEWIEQSPHSPPRSPYVEGGLARPDVVWFGESLPEKAFQSALAAATRCEVCLTIGTTALVQPAASLPFIALESGAAVVEINPEETPLSPHASQSLRCRASEGLVTLVKQLAGRRPHNDGAAAPAT